MYVENGKVTRQELLELARARVVTTAEVARMLRISRGRAARLAFELKRRGLLTRIQRGVYASVPLEVEPGSLRPDRFVAVQKALGEGYAFSHFSALALLGGEHNVRRSVHVVARDVRPRRRWVGEIAVQVRRIPTQAWIEDISVVRRGGSSLRVTTPERTLVDLAALPAAQQDYEEELAAFRCLLPRSDPGTLARELRRVRRRKTLARAGHLLRESGLAKGEFSKLLSVLRLRAAPAGPSYFGTEPKVPGNRFDPDFKLVYPGAT